MALDFGDTKQIVNFQGRVLILYFPGGYEQDPKTRIVFKQMIIIKGREMTVVGDTILLHTGSINSQV